ncbi:MAG TPA: SNF2-related protein, partial [Bacillota bacterium]
MPLTCLQRVRRIWERAGVRYYPYQLDTAGRVVDELGGRAIMADEVGLGKTIEAGLVICELMHRGQAERVLILTPSSLTAQWAGELEQKFDLTFEVNPDGRRWQLADRIIASLDLAKRPPQRAILEARTFDLVIVDEAHRLKNRSTQNHKFVKALKSRYLLLLSATPLQNDLTELYSLVSLVKPHLFGSYNEFWRHFLIDKRTPKNPEVLRGILAEVMIRHRRRDLRLEFPDRRVALMPLRLFPDEQRLYDAVTSVVRGEYARHVETGASILPLLMLQREVCSSAHAVAGTLGRLAQRSDGDRFADLYDLARGIRHHRKAYVLLGLIPEIGEKAIVFTEFRATQDYLADLLREAGIPTVKFHGEQASWEKEQAIRRFQGDSQVLISTECGGHGLNLQFCRNVINYDLPWNPMRVEQRIGRVHRLGQAADAVYI